MGYLIPETLEKLAGSIEAYDERAVYYDEVFHEVHRRVLSSGSLGKSDLGALVLWKRIQANTKWAERLLLRPEEEVRYVTGEAYSPGKSDEERLEILARLDGFRSGKSALASTVLSAWNPGDFGVIDRWSRRSITLFQMWRNDNLYPIPLAGSIMSYTTYLIMVRHMRDQLTEESGKSITARDVDKGLFWIGREEPYIPGEDRFG